jgi:hypothetical protein
MVNHLYRSYEKERNGAAKVTGKTMDSKIESWLYRKGFTEQHHIDALEETRRSLIHSCILLSYVLPRVQQGTEGPSESMVSNRAEGKGGT